MSRKKKLSSSKKKSLPSNFAHKSNNKYRYDAVD